MEWLSGLVETAVLVAFALGAVSVKWLLDLCLYIAWRYIQRPDPVLGGALFLFVLCGLPALVVTFAFATGRLPVSP